MKIKSCHETQISQEKFLIGKKLNITLKRAIIYEHGLIVKKKKKTFNTKTRSTHRMIFIYFFKLP